MAIPSAELESLKTELRALVVSCPTRMDVQCLGRDYRNMMGTQIPIHKFGYRNLVQFLQERCSDSFLFHGAPNNPTLTLIVSDQLKHIDKFVQKQKISSTAKFKGKRYSVQAEQVRPITKNNHQDPIKPQQHTISKPTIDWPNEINMAPSNGIQNGLAKISLGSETDTNQNETRPANVENVGASKETVQKFMRQRVPLLVPSDTPCEPPHHEEQDSGRHSTSSGSLNSKQMLLQELKVNIKQLVEEHPDGIWSTELLKMYRERFHRELKFDRLGFTSIISFLNNFEDVLDLQRPEPLGDWKVLPPRTRRPASSTTSRAPATLTRTDSRSPDRRLSSQSRDGATDARVEFAKHLNT